MEIKLQSINTPTLNVSASSLFGEKLPHPKSLELSVYVGPSVSLNVVFT